MAFGWTTGRDVETSITIPRYNVSSCLLYSVLVGSSPVDFHCTLFYAVALAIIVVLGIYVSELIYHSHMTQFIQGYQRFFS